MFRLCSGRPGPAFVRELRHVPFVWECTALSRLHRPTEPTSFSRRETGYIARVNFAPAYMALAETGELRRRAEQAVVLLAKCRLCPHRCRADRLHDRCGACGIGRRARVASYGPHHGEEDCLRGWRGSGSIFFSGCNLRCVFCQNWDISHESPGFRPAIHMSRLSETSTAEALATMMLELQERGCHNINWVTPTHVVPQCIEALALAAERGLRLPIVYNSSGYDAVETLHLLDGVVDIYMPDFKFWDAAIAAKLTNASDYPQVARAALKEMHRQVGVLQLDADGLARRGLLVRHLVMPDNLAGTADVARWLATKLSPDTYLNVMAQYHPAGDALGHEQIARPITAKEFRTALEEARAAGLHRFDQR